ncbi:MAG: LEPR-XLL domain-containing protein, partial [Phycisphaerales bacterium]|nr:LEPR-XLL domain-containing protein [Phycisphaerales bacterium]
MRSIKDTCGDMVVFEALEPRLLLSGTIEGQLWHDLNADGVKDAGEPGLAGWTIELTDLLLGGTMTTATSGDGQYSFDALLPGSYEVRQIDQTGWTQTAPGEPGYHAVELVDDALGLDFGDVQTGSLSGVSFNDLDGNSVRDPGEPGLAGWTLELVDSSTGAVVAITVTSAGAFEGEYEFTNVIPGDYEVRQTAQVGWVQSYPVTSTHSFSVSGGDDLTGNNFGNTQGALASGQKYSDLNANGVRDAGEPGLDGWTIELYESQSGLLVDTVVTTSIDLDESGDIDPETESGLYTFIVLDPVELLGEPVSEIMDAISVNEFYRSSKQWKSTTSMSGAVGNNVYRYSGTVKNAWWVFDNLPEAQYRVWASWGLNAAIASSAEVPYSIYEGGTISGGSSSASYTGGTLHEEFIVDQTALPSDELEGGIWWRSLGEHIVEGQLVVEIQGPQDGSVEDVRCAFADAIRIEGTPANYIIREVAKPGWTQTFPNSQEQYAALQIGRLATEMDFGNYQQGLISGQKFNDLDGDGLRDAGEPGLDGWSIELLDSSTSEIIETAITSGGGLYSFANLAPGGYQVREVLQDGWRQTYPNPEVYSFTLISGDVIGGTDFGNVELASISGVKFEDLNSDGVWDAGESGLDGWTIELLNADTGELLESQITSEGGLYSFVDLEAGTYQVIEIPQAGWMQTLPATSYYTVPLHYGDHIVEKDFGNYPLPGEIFGQKFEDINANGVKDAGEPGLADWRIYLDLNNSGQWDSGEPFDLTDSLGNYEITVLSPGFYTLAEELQSGWLQSMPGQESRQEIERVSVDSAGTQADEGSYTTSISGDGRYVAFESDAFNLIDGDTNGCRDVFVYDRLVDLTERVSVNSTGSQANASSNSASISADGRYVAFVSQANNLVPGDPATGGIFVHDRQTGLTECVTIDPTGAQAFGGAYY